MVIFQSVLAFIVLVGILVFIHELGHFLAARWCGMRADVFAVGMGPRVLGYNRINGFSFGKLPEGIDLGPYTDYRLSAFPVGGYVKIAGMVDESMDTSFATHEPQPWEFRSKGALAKAFVISAGVIMNFLLAILVLAGLNLFAGKEVVGTTTVGPIATTSPAYMAGLRPDDRITAVNGTPVTYFDEIPKRIYVDEALNDVTLSVVRNGAPTTVVIPRKTIPANPETATLIPPKVGVYVGSTVGGSPAETAGIAGGDTVLAVDGTSVAAVDDFRNYVSTHADHPIQVLIKRGADTLKKAVQPGKDKLIGVELGYYPVSRVRFGVGEALLSGVTETGNLTGNIFKGIGALVTGHANLKESVAGPAMIAQAAQKATSRGLVPSLNLLVIISIGLACMNILPIPALDGGHLVFIIIEGIMRREVPIKIRMAVQNVGFFLLILLMAFVMYNDLSKLKLF